MNNYITSLSQDFISHTNQDFNSNTKTKKRDTLETLLCFSHLRWDFVFQRPQHLMTRAALGWRVFYIEEPIFSGDVTVPEVQIKRPSIIHPNLMVVTPCMPFGFNDAEVNQAMKELLSALISSYQIENYGLWYYTPMALKFTKHLLPNVVIFDSMDELSAFKGAPTELLSLEKELYQKTDLVFTGGKSLFEAKCHKHPEVHFFPSSIDVNHFMEARDALPEPKDQEEIPYPRMGFYGVIDERFDVELLRELSFSRPDWQFIIIGPVVKIDPATLPQRKNIHYLGMKSYKELPTYLSGWNVALLLFALNESTRFISPTKTPEYLAALKPVVSTPIQDVVDPYEALGLVSIARDAEAFEGAIEEALQMEINNDWKEKVDAYLKTNSWDITWQKMMVLINEKILIS